MNRDKAIEAAARALDPMAWTSRWLDPEAQEYAQGFARDRAALAIDAALPHLTGEPVGYVHWSWNSSHPHLPEDVEVTESTKVTCPTCLAELVRRLVHERAAAPHTAAHGEDCPRRYVGPRTRQIPPCLCVPVEEES